MRPAPSDHFNGKTFIQPHHVNPWRRRDFWRWQLFARPVPWPPPAPLQPQSRLPAPQADDVIVTWIGHASFLLQSARGNFLFDPVFSERASPLTWVGPRRNHPPGLALKALPRIDGILLSHDHYDHCDLPSLRQLAAAHDAVFIAPLRHADLLEQAGAKKIHELDWWQTLPLGLTPDATATLTPSKHWSNRLGSPRNHRLWGGFYLRLGPKRIWFVGDSGYDAEIFRAIRERLRPPDLALVPIGAYEPRWFMAPMHMNPAEAVQAHRDVGARRSIGMHWGTFQLTDEGRDDPVHALMAARLAAGLLPADFDILAPGQSVVV